MHRPSTPVIEAIMSDDDEGDEHTLSIYFFSSSVCFLTPIPAPQSTMPPTPPAQEPDKDIIIMPPIDEDELQQRLKPYTCDWDDDHQIVEVCSPNEIPAVLPQYSERDPASDGLNIFGRLVSTFTLYNELRSVRLEDQYEPIFRRQLSEWTYVGGCLIALASVDAAVFAIGSDSLFEITPVARSLIATSSTSSGLGIVCTAWFIFRYNFAPTPVISTRARDIFDSYFFFALSARMPVVCMLISGGALMVFLVIVAWESYPEGVLVVSGFVGMMMTLQFLVWGFWKLGLALAWVVRILGLVWLMKRVMALGRKAEVPKEETTTVA